MIYLVEYYWRCALRSSTSLNLTETPVIRQILMPVEIGFELIQHYSCQRSMLKQHEVRQRQAAGKGAMAQCITLGMSNSTRCARDRRPGREQWRSVARWVPTGMPNSRTLV